MGVQILNKDVSVISSVLGRAKAGISNVGGIGGWAGGGGGGGFQPGDFNFNDTSVFGAGSTNTVTFTKSGTLFISVPQSVDANMNLICNFSKNSPATLGFFDNEMDAIGYVDDPYGTGGAVFAAPNWYAVCDVEIGNTMYFDFANEFGGGDAGTTITFRINSFTGTIIDTCFISLL